MNDSAMSKVIYKHSDHRFFTESSSVSTSAHYGFRSPQGIGAYGTAVDPSLVDCPEARASGFIIRTAKEEGTQRPVKCLWLGTVVPAGLLGLSSFLALETDKQDLTLNESTSSWERLQERSQAQSMTAQLSLDQASALALRVFTEAEREIQAEREAEARFLAILWQDE